MTYATPNPMFSNSATYDAIKGLKTTSTYAAPGALAGFNHTETYAYEAERDFLVGVDYADVMPNAG